MKQLAIGLLLLLSSCSTTTVYLVRHAEKVDESDSTDLSIAGKARAVALADTLVNKHVDLILTTPYRRTRQTAEPLAQRLNLPIEAYPAAPIDAGVSRINRVRNKTLLVVGHSNTVLELARGLGVTPTLTKINGTDFDNLLRVRIRRTPFRRSVQLRESTYGQSTQ
ncbi:SixA phosphatase family protein [Spirosoma rhododendri]|uniref:Phosphoglycerate mutase n=1 Tax=Spirosoma rhododendri TaxID=2728024 RepID=A0A7L5DLN2_9BACT|nr:histidine phosphatase family protein [Spirosoma rhododendri]QJD78432.1 phosphoglycerate mutase [Spirosoma rhododendri]